MAVLRSILFFTLSVNLIAQDSTQVELPQKIGPIIDALPVLDSLIVVEKDTVNQKQPVKNQSTSQPVNRSTDQSKSYPINASGTFFRGIEMSSQGAGGLSGGLRFQLAGKLSETIRISGTVTDESIPIQPEGTTAALDELDKVYLNVSYPAGELTAGDITVINRTGKYNNNNRKIVGIKNNINRNYTQIRAVVGQSKGKYHRLEIKGKDGHQGPYFLTSKEGLRNVVVSAGSEIIWLNGEKLSRGEDRDYTIDYAAGELTFTPNNLIYFDSDIDIEYQYSESNFKTNYVEAGLDGNIGNRFQYNIAYIDERDNTAGSFLSSEQKTAFQNENVLYQSGVVPDSVGDYEKINNIFVYMIKGNPSPNRYTVTFSPDPAGSYVRKISDQNRIYYEYVGEGPTGNGIDRYSPGRSIKAPGSQQFFQVNSTLQMKEGSILTTEGAFSLQDKNIFSSNKNAELNGNAFRLEFNREPMKLGLVQIGYKVEHWQNSTRFSPMSRDRHVNFNEEWDLTGPSNAKEALSSLSSQIHVGDAFTGQVGFSRFNCGLARKNRLNLDLGYRGHYIHQMNLNLNEVRSDSLFRMANLNVKLLRGPIQPFMKYSHELRENSYRFDDSVVGLTYSDKRKEFSIGIGQREDKKDSAGVMKTDLKGQFLQVDLKSRDRDGWRQEWMYRQRVQKTGNGQTENDFNALRSALNYRKRNSPFQFDLVMNSLTSMSEARAVVYDSIGVGLGHYRFDFQLNEYISDPNGAYVAHTVFTGKREHGSRLDGLTRFSLDFSKWKFDRLKDWKYRFLNRVDFHGPKISIGQKFNGDGVQWYRQNNRHELIHKRRKQKNRHRIWNQNSSNFNGLDPRGWANRYKQEWGGESQIALQDNYHIVLEGDTHESRVESERDRVTKRSVDGYAFEAGVKNFRSSLFQWETRFIYYWDRAGIGGIRTPISGLNIEKVWAYGMKMNWLHFIGKDGRIEGKFEYYMAHGFESMPPEALKGIADGRTIRSNIRASFFLGKSLSVNATLLYLDDERYDGFIKLRGEVRAHF